MLVSHEWTPAMETLSGAHLLINIEIRGRGDIVYLCREEYFPPTVGHVCFADKRCAGFEHSVTQR